jgi:hypothetical protein
MASIHLVREQSLGFDENGQSVSTDEFYIKLRASLIHLMPNLSGVREHFFFLLCLHEPEIFLRTADPFTISDLVKIGPYSERAVRYAAPWLLQHNLIVKAGTKANGEVMYRPSGYAWFGQDHQGMQKLQTPSPSGRPQPAAAPTAKGDVATAKTDTRLCKKTRAALQKRTHYVGTVVDLGIQDPITENEQQQQHEREHVKLVLRRAGFNPPALDVLAERMDLLAALQWAYWVESKPNGFTQPVGYAVKRLSLSRLASPPRWRDLFEMVRGNPDRFKCAAHCTYCEDEGAFDLEIAALLSLEHIGQPQARR